MPADPTYDPGTPEQAEYARQVADQERQQRRLAQAEAEARERAGGTAAPDGLAVGQVAAKLSPTAIALQWCWRLYFPTFSLTSIYIFLHTLLRYVFHFNFFCPADQGSPFAGVGGASAAKASALGGGVTDGVMEKVWIALGIASIAPIAAAVGLVLVLADVAEHPGRYAWCATKYVGLEAVTVTLADGRSAFMKCVLSGRYVSSD